MNPLQSRRRFLGGLLSACALPGALTWPSNAAWARDPAIDEGLTLADPDFSRLADNPYVIGIRPHRIGGMRLELEEAPLVNASNGPKYLIHNYGHGGAGITLAWGCAAEIMDRVEEARTRLSHPDPSVAIIGTGVMGLTTASELRCRWPGVPITIYARDLDLRSTTSHLAGGQFEPSGVWREYRKGERKAFLGSILQRSRDHIDALGSRAARYGILARSNYTLDQDQRSMDLYTPRDVIPEADRGLLPFENLRVPGRRYRNWLINPTILLPMLRGELQVAGVSFVERNFESRSDLARLPHEIIINCTGYGARALLGDDALVPQRGHLITLERTDEAQNYLFGGGCENGVIFYAFCRQNDIVIGGTIQTGDDREALLPEDPAVFERILSNGALLFGGHPDQCEP